MAFTSASHAQELQRLGKLLAHYEAESVYQKRQLEEAADEKNDLITRIQGLEQEKAQLQKKLRSTEISLKFEKVAAEGARKKAHMIEIDLVDVRERYENAKTELDMLKKREKEMTLTLQQERISRLQILHEKERVQRLNEDLHQKLCSTETDNAQSHERLLSLLQHVETLLEQNHRQDRLIGAQSTEIYTLTNEVVDYKLNSMDLNRTIEEEAQSHSRYQHAIDFLQQEISRLRKALSDEAQDVTGRSHSVYTTTKSQASNTIVQKVNALTAARFTESRFTADHIFSTRAGIANGTVVVPPDSTSASATPSLRSASSPDVLKQTRRAQSDAMDMAATMPSMSTTYAFRNAIPARTVSPLSSAQRPRSTNDFKQVTELEGSSWSTQQEEESYFHSEERAHMLDWIRKAGSRQKPRGGPEVVQEQPSLTTASGTLSLPPLSSSFFTETSKETEMTPDRDKGVKASVKKTAKGYDSKSMYVGSGLGFKHNKDLNTQLKDLQAGSTKQILQRILGDHIS